jgi:hypothetical protein
VYTIGERVDIVVDDLGRGNTSMIFLARHGRRLRAAEIAATKARARSTCSRCLMARRPTQRRGGGNL